MRKIKPNRLTFCAKKRKILNKNKKTFYKSGFKDFQFMLKMVCLSFTRREFGVNEL